MARWSCAGRIIRQQAGVCSNRLDPQSSDSCCVGRDPKRFISRHSQHQPLKWSYVHGTSQKPFLGVTIGKLLAERAEKHPDRAAMVFFDKGIQKTFAQLLEEADQLAAGFLSLGMKRGDRLGIWGPNSLEWVLTQYATARAGISLVNINPSYKENELQFILKKTGIKALVSAESFRDQNYYEMLFQLLPELVDSKSGSLHGHRTPDLRSVIMMGGKKHPGTFSFDEVIQAGTTKQREEIVDLQDKIQFDDPVNIQFTSGTTGFPKGATLSHHGLINNSYFVGQNLDYHNRDTRICLPVPLYHTFGCVIGSLNIVTNGACCVFPSENFDAGLVLNSIQTERCTSLYGVPTMFIDILHHPDFDKFDLTSLYTGIMAGSPCPVEVMQKVIEKMNLSNITEMTTSRQYRDPMNTKMVCYGTTETSPVTFQTAMYDPMEKRISTVGRAIPNVEAKIINEEGNLVPISSSGELCVRGYMTMLHYWDEAEKTAEVIKNNNWYHSGDIATMDEAGFCKIIGRIKDMIIRGGENVYPVEIEQLLYKHPQVKDVQVVGVPDKRLGEEIIACVILKGDQTCSAEELREFCRASLARHKIPRYIHFVDSYPMTVTGKIQKFLLRELAIKKLGLEHEAPL